MISVWLGIPSGEHKSLAGSLRKIVAESVRMGFGDAGIEIGVLEACQRMRWLSRGNAVNRVFELRGELKSFLEVHGKDDLLSHFNKVLWEPRLACLADIFEQLNRLNLKLQDHLLDPSLKTDITQHLKSLENEFKRYSPEFEEEEGKLLRNPFSGTLDIATIPNYVQDKFLDLKNDFAAKDLYQENC
ncbi:protein FAM200A-like [Homarus americanus]|uniref:protein FAM200A-like n=1 Tax=Homarus americanus TaxID=6706 RepID=UPI001C44A3C6|nr:protein FAM200A-like [Homarus americanus]